MPAAVQSCSSDAHVHRVAGKRAHADKPWRRDADDDGNFGAGDNPLYDRAAFFRLHFGRLAHDSEDRDGGEAAILIGINEFVYRVEVDRTVLKKRGVVAIAYTPLVSVPNVISCCPFTLDRAPRFPRSSDRGLQWHTTNLFSPASILSFAPGPSAESTHQSRVAGIQTAPSSSTTTKSSMGYPLSVCECV